MPHMRRDQALIGYLVFRVARKIVRKRLAGAPGAALDRGRRAKGRARRVTSRPAEVGMGLFQNGAKEKAGAGVAAGAPYVVAAVRDPEFQVGLGRAAAAGRGALETLRGESPRNALHLLATDERLQSKLGRALQEVDDALERVGLEAEVKRRRRGKLLLLVGAIVAAAVGVALATRLISAEPPAEPIEPGPPTD